MEIGITVILIVRWKSEALHNRDINEHYQLRKKKPNIRLFRERRQSIMLLIFPGIPNAKRCYNESSQTLPLIIKKYTTPGALSAIIHDSPNTQYIIQGPFGLGLELKEKS